MKKYKQVYERVKKDCPGWIGFQEKRCFYDSELADRIRRIRKVSEWKIEKAFQEYYNDVQTGVFPEKKNIVEINEKELDTFLNNLEKRG